VNEASGKRQAEDTGNAGAAVLRDLLFGNARDLDWRQSFVGIERLSDLLKDDHSRDNHCGDYHDREPERFPFVCHP
jgi:hypothetical protein